MSGKAAGLSWPRPSAPAVMHDYALFAWRVRSAVALPEAVAWRGDDRLPDVTVSLGAAPALAPPVVYELGPLQVGGDGVCRFSVKQIGDFLVRDGREVIVEPHGDLAAPEFRAWLLGPVAGVLCHQRGLFPLHASSVRIGGGAVALAGRAGAGKSTLAAAIVRRGHGLIADDVCAIDPAAPDAQRVRPGFPRLKLWEDAVRALGIPVAGMPRANSGKRKFHFCQPGIFDPSPVGLRAIYLLTQATDADGDAIRPVGRPQAAGMLSHEIYRGAVGLHLGRKMALSVEALRIAAAVPVFRLPVRPNLSELDAVAARVEAHVISLPR